MRYLSVCSGIEAATVAWHPLGWTPVAFSEIEAFPSAVLAHHYPSVPNLGDMTKHESWPLDVGSIDLLVGGTPCQSFSVAGLRKGLSDPRGGLMLTYLEIARRLRPRWIVWENVPGVLSSGRGRDFGSFLGALGELGYGWAYRMLDAQWVRTQRHPRAVPQRRRRVFVVGCLGDWNAPAAVLFERESVQRNPSPRGASRQGASTDAQGCAGTVSSKWSKGTGGPAGDECYNLIAADSAQRMPDKDNLGAVLTPWPADVAATLAQSRVGSGSPGFSNQEVFSQGCANIVPIPFRKSKRAQSATDDESWIEADQANTVNAFDTGERDTHAIVHALPDIPKPPEDQVCVECGNDIATAEMWHCMECLEKERQQHAVAFHPTQDVISAADGSAHCIGTGSGGGCATVAVAQSMTVRRLTPRECERLQAFPDDYTRIPWRKRDAADCPDGPRYKALGNSMAVNCMEWIGERIAAWEAR